MKLTLNLLIGMLAIAASEILTAQVMATQVAQQVSVRMIPRQEFCNKLVAGLKQYSLASGYNLKQSGMIASAASDDLVAAFKTGRATDYLNPEALAALAGGDVTAKGSAYIPIANFLGPALGIAPTQTVLALSAAELRFIPHVQQGMNIVVIAQNAAPLTPERAKAVAETAAKLKVRIHVLWVGEPMKSPSAEVSSTLAAESQAMAFLSAVTGGSFADLSGTDHCGSSL